MSWTDERVELLRQLWLDGKSASQISAQLGHGVTRNAVIGKVHRLGLAQIIVQSTREPGAIKLTATAKGLSPATVSVQSQPCTPRPAVP
jgi:GcrA cell cycle regulator